MKRSLMILAAGVGSRYGGPKQVDPVGPSGEFLLEYSVYDAIRAGFERVVFVIRRDMGDDFKEAMGHRLEKQIETDYVYQQIDDVPEQGRDLWPQRTRPWGTAHAVRAGAAAEYGPFAVINADDFYGADSYRSLAGFLKETADDDLAYAMVGFVLRNTLSPHGAVARGVCHADDEGHLLDVREHTAIREKETGIVCEELDHTLTLTGDELVSMNMWAFKPSFFKCLDQEFVRFLASKGKDTKAEYLLPSVVQAAMVRHNARVRVLKSHGRWFGMTNPEDREAVMAAIRALVDQDVYPPSLW